MMDIRQRHVEVDTEDRPKPNVLDLIMYLKSSKKTVENVLCKQSIPWILSVAAGWLGDSYQSSGDSRLELIWPVISALLCLIPYSLPGYLPR